MPINSTIIWSLDFSFLNVVVISNAEAVGPAASPFIGLCESARLVRHYLNYRVARSELYLNMISSPSLTYRRPLPHVLAYSEIFLPSSAPCSAHTINWHAISPGNLATVLVCLC